MLLGTWRQSIERRGQLLLPRSFRSALGERMVLTRGFEPCIQAFSLEAWQQLATRIKQTSIGEPSGRALRRQFFGNAAELSIDERGRFTLPPDLQQYAGIDAESLFVGLDSYFEIWAENRWQQTLEQSPTRLPTFV
jgi:MraZ protein